MYRDPRPRHDRPGERRGIFGAPETTTVYRTPEGVVAIRVPDADRDEDNRHRKPGWALFLHDTYLGLHRTLTDCRGHAQSIGRHPRIRSGRGRRA